MGLIYFCFVHCLSEVFICILDLRKLTSCWDKPRCWNCHVFLKMHLYLSGRYQKWCSLMSRLHTKPWNWILFKVAKFSLLGIKRLPPGGFIISIKLNVVKKCLITMLFWEGVLQKLFACILKDTSHEIIWYCYFTWNKLLFLPYRFKNK